MFSAGQSRLVRVSTGGAGTHLSANAIGAFRTLCAGIQKRDERADGCVLPSAIHPTRWRAGGLLAAGPWQGSKRLQEVGSGELASCGGGLTTDTRRVCRVLWVSGVVLLVLATMDWAGTQ